MTVVLHINGRACAVEAEPQTPLLLVLRNDLGLYGAKLGCAQEQCGSCTVIVDGAARMACKLAIGGLADSAITTLEGIGTRERPHALQRAFMAENAAQCGYCTAGMVMAAKALLDRNPRPAASEIRAALRDNLCRCGTHDRVVRAVQRAAGEALAGAAPKLVHIRRRSPRHAQEHADPTGGNRPRALSASLRGNPRLDDWIRIDAAETITVRTGKVELGQGITTAIALIAAEELDVGVARIRVETADSARLPNELMTVGSMSIETSGAAVRQAAAEARHQLLARAAERLGVARDALVVADGEVRVRDGDARVSYWQLMGGRAFGCAVSREVAPKDASEHRVVGRHAQRVDLADKLFGAPRFVHDLTRPGMLHGRVVRSASPHAALRSVEIAPVRALPGVVEVVRDGSFLGVIAEREEQAIAAADALRARCVFEENAALPEEAALFEQLRSDLVGSYPLVQGTPVEQPVPPVIVPEGAAHTCSATYTRPFLMHASIGPSAALALYDGAKLEVHCSSQGVAVLQLALAQALRMDAARVRVVHAEGAGCYGHNGADDAALDAALLARAVPGRPVLLKWSRGDEHACEPYGPAMRVDVSASIDGAGRVLAYNHDVYSYTHIGRAFPGGRSSALIAAQQLAEPLPPPRPRPMLAPQAGVHRNADPLYDVPEVRVVKHLANHAPLRTSSLRSLGAFTNVFAMESMIDELAAAAGIEPVALRLAHLRDARAREVIEAGAERAGFDRPKAAGDPRRPRGRGMAFSRYENHKCYAAVFVELEVDLATFAIQLLRATIAADAGLIVDPDGLANQLEGGFIQAASWTLLEQVRFDAQRITSLDWESYPIMRFEQVPAIEVILLDRLDEASRGAGEATTGPTPAAIANAVYDACGARLRSTPFSPAKLRAALYG